MTRLDKGRATIFLGLLQLLGMVGGIVCYVRGRQQSLAPAQRRKFSAKGMLWQTMGVVLMVSAFPVFIALFALYGAPGGITF